MAFTFDATPAGAGANTYATLTQANDLLAGRLRTEAWDGATTTQRQRALVMATLQLDGLRFASDDSPAAQDQALTFPRAADPRDAAGAPAVPAPVFQAAAIHALALLAGDAASATDRLALQAQGVRAVRIGDVTEAYAARAGDLWDALSPEVRALLEPFRDPAGRGRRRG